MTVYIYIYISVGVGVDRQRERERERERETQTESERERERDRQTDSPISPSCRVELSFHVVCKLKSQLHQKPFLLHNKVVRLL